MSNLKTRRQACGLSQVDLANRSRVPVRQIRAYEAEAATAHADINRAAAVVVFRLARALGCRVEDLLEPDEY